LNEELNFRLEAMCLFKLNALRSVDRIMIADVTVWYIIFGIYFFGKCVLVSVSYYENVQNFNPQSYIYITEMIRYLRKICLLHCWLFV